MIATFLRIPRRGAKLPSFESYQLMKYSRIGRRGFMHVVGAASFVSPAKAMSRSNSKQKIIFDTDPGIDDAMALLFIQKSPVLELVGITTVAGNGLIDTVTRNTLYLKDRFGIKAPIAKGAGPALDGSVSPASTRVHGENGLGDILIPPMSENTLDPRPGWKFISDIVRQYPGEVTLVAVGHFTNLAQALRYDPDVVKFVKDVVVMGGAFGFDGYLGNRTPCAESNIYGDPIAADEVFSAQWKVTIVGLDVTMKLPVKFNEIDQLKQSNDPACQLLWAISRKYVNYYRQEGLDHIYIHDAAAVAAAINPALFTRRSGAVRVVTEGFARGETIQKPDDRHYLISNWDNRPSQSVCIDVDSSKLKNLFFETILKK